MKIFDNAKKILPGILLAFSIALPAYFLGSTFPLIGAPIFGMLLGMLLARWQRPEKFRSGIAYSSKKILQYAIILLGFEMNLYSVFKVGSQSLAVMIATTSASFLTAWFVGKSLNLRGNTATLIGVGSAICGGSAIAATAPVIKADDKEIAYSISTIFLFNITAALIFPMIGHLMQMSNMGFGIWAGTAINDTSSVVAAGYSYSNAAGNLATIVKLTRTLLIIPVTLTLSFIVSRKSQESGEFNFVKIFPWFVLGFIGASVVKTAGLLPDELCSFLAQSGKFLIIVAMSAIGLNVNFKAMAKNGIRPILLGLACSLAVALSSLASQHMLSLW
ncbi:hypothetical protein EAL2_808p00810 (plasmid) [Peptoclostridium acidaminophilum DSM 3953]|uniref:Uncharacterized protein n=1 Tax=Peptoclostridium acidaminophilum DSM 3953 TaxID=1286171 RepID=W8TIC9_PEPAC|nr:YeiH family protein [Peptoclostridium acidaminophilum]AHM57588.1 hypothetical protein EAL2_808p00810 [Peptoclostridium acidaminophilum DSM 3953]